MDILRWKCQECGRFLMNVDLKALRNNCDSRVLDTHCPQCKSDNELKVFKTGQRVEMGIRRLFVKK